MVPINAVPIPRSRTVVPTDKVGRTQANVSEQNKFLFSTRELDKISRWVARTEFLISWRRTAEFMRYLNFEGREEKSENLRDKKRCRCHE